MNRASLREDMQRGNKRRQQWAKRIANTVQQEAVTENNFGESRKERPLEKKEQSKKIKVQNCTEQGEIMRNKIYSGKIENSDKYT